MQINTFYLTIWNKLQNSSQILFGGWSTAILLFPGYEGKPNIEVIILVCTGAAATFLWFMLIIFIRKLRKVRRHVTYSSQKSHEVNVGLGEGSSSSESRDFACVTFLGIRFHELIFKEATDSRLLWNAILWKWSAELMFACTDAKASAKQNRMCCCSVKENEGKCFCSLILN